MIFSTWTTIRKQRVRVTYSNHGTSNPNHFWVSDVIKMVYGRAVKHTVKDYKATQMLKKVAPHYKLVPKPSTQGL